MVTCTVIITNPNGLHMRPASHFAATAQKFSSSITIRWGDRVVDGKSVLELLLLAASKGTELTVEARGHDASPALAELSAILESPHLDEPD